PPVARRPGGAPLLRSGQGVVFATPAPPRGPLRAGGATPVRPAPPGGAMIDFALESMIQQQLVSRGISDQAVIRAFRRVSRRAFVPDYLQHQAYADEVLPIGCGQTLTSPYVIALMLQQLRLSGDTRVLEVGTGSGFQTALL